MAETAIGWEGITITPTFQKGALDLAAEFSYITYDTNWQAWGDPSKSITNTPFPAMDMQVGMGSYRSAYAPFQDKTTQIDQAEMMRDALIMAGNSAEWITVDTEGHGFLDLVANLPQERLSIAVSAVAAARQALTWTLDYCKEREAFGQPIAGFQNTRFWLAEMTTEVTVAETFIDQWVLALNDGLLTAINDAIASDDYDAVYEEWFGTAPAE
mgnify:CR=1 FL=1